MGIMKLWDINVDELFLRVWKDHWGKERFTLSGHARVVKSNFDKHLRETFGHLPLNKISRLMVDNWHKRIESTIAANRSLEILSKLFNWALQKEVFNGANPCSFVVAHKEKKRKRFATRDELIKIQNILFAKVHHKKTRTGATFLLALIYSGARPRSLERALWSDFRVDDSGFGHLVFEGKSSAETGEEETVLFPPNIVGLLKALPRRKRGLIFGIGMPKKMWKQIREEAVCPDLWARDMRRTFATVGLSNGVKIDTLGELLNHKSTQTTKIYAKLDGSARREAVGHIADKMMAILTDTKKVSGE